MGKHFYGTHADKTTAKAIAQTYAAAYRKKVCYTPAQDKHCVFNNATGMWTCRVSAHHQYGSCNAHDIPAYGGKQRSWSVGGSWTYLASPQVDGAGVDESLSIGQEAYQDAAPEDYAQ